jgi:DNA polymerase-3 subunit alpha
VPPASPADFVHLHNHTQYSLLDGSSRVEDICDRAAEWGMPAVAATDHGNLFCAVKFYKAARRAGIKPIIGAEVYVAPGSRTERRIHPDIQESSFHLTLLCRDDTGYYNLVRLVSRAFLEGFYYRPRIDKELLGQYSEGLIGMSGCLKGEVNWWLARGDTEAAMRVASGYQELLGPDNFYLEVMRAGFEEQERIIPGIVEVSQNLEIPMVATNDCHYLRAEDARAHDVLVCIQTGKRLDDNRRLRMSSGELYFRSPEEMARKFHDMPEAVSRTVAVAERCNLSLDFDDIRFLLPKFDTPPGFADAFSYLRHETELGLRERFREPSAGISSRMDQELDIIREMGFPGYFLVVKDIVDFARRSGIPVGPGRGSAAGSLVLYALGITDIDPLRHNLLFERFLNTERVSLPDIDIDFSDTRRQEVVDYIRKRYGDDSVAQIITFGTMQARAVVRDVGRVLDVPIPEVDRIAKLIPQGLDLEQAVSTSFELRQLIESKPEYQDMIDIAKRLEGLNRHASIHASAVVIAPRPLIDIVPLYKSAEGDVCTQFDMYSLDSVGLLKLDVLGLRTLTVVEEAQRLIRESGTEVDVEHLPQDDAKTFALLAEGNTDGVFQLESSGMRDLCRRMRPESIEHITALIALYRPGPMDLIPSYLARKEGTEPIEYEHPLLEDICRETYGILIYQEQVMQAAQALAGYTLGKADLLRRAMGKKKPEEMAAQHDVFIEGCAKSHNIPRRKAEKIFNLLAKFAGYGFNKSHAAGYAQLSYITAWLKANHPVEFMAATLTSELGDFKKVASFVGAARRMGLEILGPDTNRSRRNFAIENGRIRFALPAVKNIGQGASERIVEEREANGEYQDLFDFLIRNKGTVNRKAAESLIMAGAFDWVDPNRTRMLADLELEMARAGSERLQFMERQADMFGPSEEEKEPEVKFDTHQLLSYEKKSLGFYFSSHPLEPHMAEYRALKLQPISQVHSEPDGTRVSLGGVITLRRIRRDKREREYFVVVVEDLEGTLEAMVFADQLESCRQHLQVDKLVIVQGRVKKREKGMAQVWADRVMSFENVNRYIKAVAVNMPEKNSKESLRELRKVLQSHPGESLVYLRRPRPGGGHRVVWVKEFKVQLNDQLVAGLESLLGKGSVSLVGELPAPVNGRQRRKRRQS